MAKISHINSGKKAHSRDQFSLDEDIKLAQFVIKYGEEQWEYIASLMLTKNARQCKERWHYYLSPTVNNKPYTSEEDQLLIDLHKKYGSKWRIISAYFQGRTNISLRNRMSLLQRKIDKMKNNNNKVILNDQSESDATKESKGYGKRQLEKREKDNIFEDDQNVEWIDTGSNSDSYDENDIFSIFFVENNEINTF